jgi:uncharacterized protein
MFLSVAKYLFFASAGVYLIMAAFVWAMQDGLIFLPQPLGAGRVPLPSGWTKEELAISTPDQVRLEVSLIRPPGAPAPLLLYFGGNAEDVSYLAQFAEHYGQIALALVHYRGFGNSTGSPSEAHLFADALLIYDTLAKRSDILASQIHAHGRSLGSGVAVYLASQRPTANLILTTPYDSMVNVAKGIYPFLPVSLLLRHRFDSLSLAPDLHNRALFLVAAQDELIPAVHARKLFDAWGGPKTWRLFTGSGHNDVSDAPGYWDTIAAFLKAADTPPR